MYNRYLYISLPLNLKTETIMPTKKRVSREERVQTAIRIPRGLKEDCEIIAKRKQSDLSKTMRRLLIVFREENKMYLNDQSSEDV